MEVDEETRIFRRTCGEGRLIMTSQLPAGPAYKVVLIKFWMIATITRCDELKSSGQVDPKNLS